jgi:hypothetical protein
MSYYVARVDAAKGLLVIEGERVRTAQPIGRNHMGGYELTPAQGRVHSIQYDGGSRSAIVYIEPETRMGGSRDAA